MLMRAVNRFKSIDPKIKKRIEVLEKEEAKYEEILRQIQSKQFWR